MGIFLQFFCFFNLPEIITIYQIDEVIYKSGINYFYSWLKYNCALFKFPLQLINYSNNKSISMYIFFIPNSYQNLKWIKEYKM